MNVFNTLTLQRIFKKTKIFFQKLEYRFLVEATKIVNQHFHKKRPCQKSILGQIEWRVQHGPITKNGVLPVTTLFFWKFCFSLKSLLYRFDLSYQPPKFSYSYYNRWSLIWGCFFPVSILNIEVGYQSGWLWLRLKKT